MAKFIIFLFLCLVANATKLEISSDSFFADEKNLFGKFTGNVKLKKENDVLSAKLLLVYFNKNKEPRKYIATDNVEFKISLKDKNYTGKANEIIYEPLKQIYNLNGDVFLKEGDKNITGQSIVIDLANGTYNALSNDKDPVKFEFEIKNEKNK